MPRQMWALLLCVLLPLLPARPARAAASLTGPVSLDSFSVSSGRLLANGRVTLPTGAVVPFTAPAAVAPLQTGNVTTILTLVLGPIDLNLLGLQAHLDQINLVV